MNFQVFFNYVFFFIFSYYFLFNKLQKLTKVKTSDVAVQMISLKHGSILWDKKIK